MRFLYPNVCLFAVHLCKRIKLNNKVGKELHFTHICIKYMDTTSFYKNLKISTKISNNLLSLVVWNAPNTKTDINVWTCMQNLVLGIQSIHLKKFLLLHKFLFAFFFLHGNDIQIGSVFSWLDFEYSFRI